MTTSTRWRRSTRSQNDSSCVELAHTLDAVRDSKNPTTALTHTLVDAVKHGRFEH